MKAEIRMDTLWKRTEKPKVMHDGVRGVGRDFLAEMEDDLMT